MKMPNFTFYERRKQATTKFFLFLNLNAVSKKSTLEKFAFFRHFHRIRIKAKKFEKTPIHFKSDVFAAVAVVDAKTPYCWAVAGDFCSHIGTVLQKVLATMSESCRR